MRAAAGLSSGPVAKVSKNAERKKTTRATRKGDFGASAEEEEWERQLMEEIEAKKAAAAAAAGVDASAPAKELSREEKSVLAAQTARREEISAILRRVDRSAAAAAALCAADVEVGNGLLAGLSPPLVAVATSRCPSAEALGATAAAARGLAGVAVGAYELPDGSGTAVAAALRLSAGGGGYA